MSTSYVSLDHDKYVPEHMVCATVYIPNPMQTHGSSYYRDYQCRLPAKRIFFLVKQELIKNPLMHISIERN